MRTEVVDHRVIVVSGTLLRIARPRDEPYDCLDDPHRLIGELGRSDVGADLLTFCQDLSERQPRYRFPLEWESVSLLAVTTHEHWWKHQISDKTRNMIRKAGKKGVEIRSVALDDDLVRAIGAIYDERPIIQGKRNRHFGRSVAAMRAMLGTFGERSEFLGAYHGEELIGFAKLVRGGGVVSLMHVLSRTSHADRAPTNALLSRAVERCAEWGMPALHYGAWSRRSLGDFKRRHAFERVEIPRYVVPLTSWGRWMLPLTLHRRLSERLPEPCVRALADVRDRWRALRFRAGKS